MLVKIWLAWCLVSWSTLVTAQNSEIKVYEPWLRQPVGRVTAAYMTIENRGEQALSVVSLASDCCKKVELHQHINDEGVMRMRKVESFVLSPQSRRRLQPGGYHIMLMGLKKPLAVGDYVTVELQMADGSMVPVVVEVKPVTYLPRQTPAS